MTTPMQEVAGRDDVVAIQCVASLVQLLKLLVSPNAFATLLTSVEGPAPLHETVASNNDTVKSLISTLVFVCQKGNLKRREAWSSKINR